MHAFTNFEVTVLKLVGLSYKYFGVKRKALNPFSEILEWEVPRFIYILFWD